MSSLEKVTRYELTLSDDELYEAALLWLTEHGQAKLALKLSNWSSDTGDQGPRDFAWIESEEV